MFIVLIEHLDNSSTQSYFVGQVYETNEIIQFCDRKLIDKSRYELSFNAITPANFMLLLRMYQILFALRLSTTARRSLIRYASLNQTGPPRRVDYLAPLWEYLRKVSFRRTQRYISQFRNRTGSRLPCDCLLAL